MKTYNLSHLITPDIPVYPGTEKPIITQASTIENDGFAEKKLTFFSHVGTHIDAPSHILKNRPSLDTLDAGSFVGQALCVTVGESLIDDVLISGLARRCRQLEFVLFNTGWSRHWGNEAYFSGFPVLTEKAARLLSSMNLKGVGFDTISADQEGSTELPIHRILLEKMIIIENLTNLDKLPQRPFFFSCLPLYIAGGDGSPVRAVAIDFAS